MGLQEAYSEWVRLSSTRQDMGIAQNGTLYVAIGGAWAWGDFQAGLDEAAAVFCVLGITAIHSLAKFARIRYSSTLLYRALAPPERVSQGSANMNRLVAKAQEPYVRKDLPNFRPGDTVRVHVRLKEAEGEKERIQPFEGVVMSRRGRMASASFTVRRVSFGIGVERIFPLHSPTISAIEVVRQGRVRRAKLNYLRGRKGKAARIKRVERFEEAAAPAPTE